MQIDAYLTDMKARLNALPENGRRKLAAVSGVGESTLRLMASPDWKPRTLDNLSKLERALIAMSADPPRRGPEPGGDGCARGEGGAPDEGAAAAQGDDAPAARMKEHVHEDEPAPGHAVRQLESPRPIQGGGR